MSLRSGALGATKVVTGPATVVGALALWDLSNAGGSIPVNLHDNGVDLAVGCTYKYLNGGPGAPAYLYVRVQLHDDRRPPRQGRFAPASSVEQALVLVAPAGPARGPRQPPPTPAHARLPTGP